MKNLIKKIYVHFFSILALISFFTLTTLVFAAGNTWIGLGEQRKTEWKSQVNYDFKSRTNPYLKYDEYNDLVNRATLWKPMNEGEENRYRMRSRSELPDKNDVILDSKGGIGIGENAENFFKNNTDDSVKLYVDGKITAKKYCDENNNCKSIKEIQDNIENLVTIEPEDGFCIFKKSGSNCPSWAPKQEGSKLIGTFNNLDDSRGGDDGHSYNITICCTE